MEPATVYYKPGCPFGIRLRLLLLLHGVPFRAVRFRDDEEGATRVRLVNDGNEISPTVHVDAPLGWPDAGGQADPDHLRLR